MEETKKMIVKLNELLGEIPNLYTLFYQDNVGEGFAKFAGIMPDLSSVMTKFLVDIPQYNLKGMEIPADIVSTQLNNLMEALQYKDTIMMGDCLKYEISESLTLYRQLLEDENNE